MANPALKRNALAKPSKGARIRTKGPTAKARAAKARQRAREYESTREQLLQKMLRAFDYVFCWQCKKATMNGQFHQTDPTNLVVLCPQCHTQVHSRGRRG